MNEFGDPAFEPSLNVLCHVIRVMLEKNSIEKIGLSQESNIQYTELLKHLEWLEKKRLVESVVEEGRMYIVLTSKGREFARVISMLCD
jgi:predicted transcriptional regulator